MTAEVTMLRDASKYLLAGSLPAFLMWSAMWIYGDVTITQYAVLMTGCFMVCCSAITLGGSHLFKLVRKL